MDKDIRMRYPQLGDEMMPRTAMGEALVELADRFPNLMVFDADVCASTQTVKFRDAFPERFYQMGIAESNMVGAAAGMATYGFTPFVSTFAVFLAKRALDQIRVSVAYPKLDVKLNGAYGGLPTGRAGATHSAVADIAVMRAMPHMRVLVPADSVETKKAVELSLSTDGPVYLRTVRCPVPTIFTGNHEPAWGKGITLTEGQDAAIISTGMMTPYALFAAEQLRSEGIHVRHIHLASIKPIDREVIIKAARETGTIFTVENHSIIGGLGGAVAEIVGRDYPCRVLPIGFTDRFMESGDDNTIFSSFSLDTEGIKACVRRAL